MDIKIFSITPDVGNFKGFQVEAKEIIDNLNSLEAKEENYSYEVLYRKLPNNSLPSGEGKMIRVELAEAIEMDQLTQILEAAFDGISYKNFNIGFKESGSEWETKSLSDMID